MTMSEQQGVSARQHWISVLAKADSKALQDQWQALAIEPEYQFIRKPEIGLTMMRGRVGGSGQPFNLGEMSLTRCAVRLASGSLGVSYVSGRNKAHALTAALADALLQEADHQVVLQEGLIMPLQTQIEAARAKRESKAAATKVDFFTLVRGED